MRALTGGVRCYRGLSRPIDWLMFYDGTQGRTDAPPLSPMELQSLALSALSCFLDG